MPKRKRQISRRGRSRAEIRLVKQAEADRELEVLERISRFRAMGRTELTQYVDSVLEESFSSGIMERLMDDIF
jgi:hypothetical protein